MARRPSRKQQRRASYRNGRWDFISIHSPRAHAEVCEFELAAQRQSQAFELVPDELLADEFRYRLKLYQSKRNPYNFGPFD